MKRLKRMKDLMKKDGEKIKSSFPRQDVHRIS